MIYQLNDGEVEVEYNFYPAYSGTYYQPPEPEYVEITAIMYKGVDVSEIVSMRDFEEIEAACIRNEINNYISYMEDKADDERDRLRGL